jgi:hypothetical protein
MTTPLPAQSGPELRLVDLGGGHVPDRRQSVLVGSTTTLAIATIFIAARLVSRVIIVRRTSWDDYTIILAWVSVLLGLRYSPGQGWMGRENREITVYDIVVDCLWAHHSYCCWDFIRAGTSGHRYTSGLDNPPEEIRICVFRTLCRNPALFVRWLAYSSRIQL